MGESIVKDLAPHKPTSKPGELGEGWERIVKDLTPHKPTNKSGGGGRIRKDLAPHRPTSKPGEWERMGKDSKGPDSS